ncbi:hypothetical protein FO519_007210 [Halicephalobus sp. NKZ332]|nr:hypothetical protein FO519_007210 [Halicephalobus sp. NKZ332]
MALFQSRNTYFQIPPTKLVEYFCLNIIICYSMYYFSGILIYSAFTWKIIKYTKIASSKELVRLQMMLFKTASFQGFLELILVITPAYAMALSFYFHIRHVDQIAIIAITACSVQAWLNYVCVIYNVAPYRKAIKRWINILSFNKEDGYECRRAPRHGIYHDEFYGNNHGFFQDSGSRSGSRAPRSFLVNHDHQQVQPNGNGYWSSNYRQNENTRGVGHFPGGVTENGGLFPENIPFGGIELPPLLSRNHRENQDSDVGYFPGQVTSHPVSADYSLFEEDFLNRRTALETQIQQLPSVPTRNNSTGRGRPSLNLNMDERKKRNKIIKNNDQIRREIRDLELEYDTKHMMNTINNLRWNLEQLQKQHPLCYRCCAQTD